jgi:hypothetical protein
VYVHVFISLSVPVCVCVCRSLTVLQAVSLCSSMRATWTLWSASGSRRPRILRPFILATASRGSPLTTLPTACGSASSASGPTAYVDGRPPHTYTQDVWMLACVYIYVCISLSLCVPFSLSLSLDESVVGCAILTALGEAPVCSWRARSSLASTRTYVPPQRALRPPHTHPLAPTSAALSP